MLNTVEKILDRKGRDVMIVAPDATMSHALRLLSEHNLGALVVSHDGHAVLGVLSERDIIHRLAGSGASILEEAVASHMSEALTCDPTMTTDVLAALMTERRIRHLPVVDAGSLAGIVSIGDVVKVRLDELVETSRHLEAYVSGRY